MPTAQDQLNSVDPERAQKVAFQALDAIQGDKAGEQVAAAGFLFLLVCERYRMNVRDSLEKSERALRDSLSRGRGEYTRAIKTYLAKEHQ